MEIKIIQSKLTEIINFLYVDGLFPYSIITTKDGKLYSVQTSGDGLAFKYVCFENEYFKYITTNEESINVDIEKLKKIVNQYSANSVITLKYGEETENKLLIESDRASNYIVLTKIDESEVKTTIPFLIKDGIPYLNKGQIPLDNHTVVSLKSLKDIQKYASIHDTEYVKFIMKNNKFEVLIGDIYGLQDYTIYKPVCKVISNPNDVEVTFTKGIQEIFKTFTSDVDIFMRSNFPAWFMETSQNHKFGLLLSPVREE